jgi:chromosome segregation protein
VLRAEEAELSARLAELDATLETDRTATAESEARLAEMSAREHELASTLRVSEVSIEAAARELSQIADRTQAQAAEVEALKLQAEALAAEREALERQREDLATLVVADEGRLSEAETSLKEAAREQATLNGEADRARGAAAAARSEASAHRSQLAQIDRQRADLKARVERSRAEGDELGRKAAELDDARSAHVEKLGKTRQLMLRLDEQRGAQEELLERTRAEFIQNEAKLITLREELAEKRSRLHSLLEIVRNYEGYGRGVRSLMTRASASTETAGEGRDRGVFGLVADVVSAPAEFENAIEALLGERLQYVIVESHAQGVEAIDYLKSAAEGRASLIPMSRLRAAARRQAQGERPEIPPAPEVELAPLPDHPGVVKHCLEVVSFDPTYEKVVKFLLADALIVRDLPSALEIWQEGAGQAGRTLVTLDGEVLDAHGVVTGGPLEGEGHGALQRRREVQELEETVRVFEAEFQLANERHRTLQARLLQLEAALKSLDKDGREKELALLEQEKDLARIGEELVRVGARTAELQADQRQLEEALAALVREEEEHRLAAAAAEAEQARAEERARESLEWIEAWKARGDVLTAELMNIKVKAAADTERREGIGAAMKRAEDARREVEERRGRLFASLSEANARAAELRGRLDGTRVDVGRVSEELAQVRQALGDARNGHEALAVAARARDAEARGLRTRAEGLREAISEASLTGREQALELSHLEEQTRERCQAELRWEVARFHMERPPGDEERTRLEELKAQAERMGAINLTAIEEYDELARRHEFMSAQKTDLERSLADLKSAIVKINRASRERFQETFDRVNEKFQAVFPRLFNGGRAGLVLTNAEGEGEQGVEIFAQPPGKKLQSVNLLSGGEKALTAVSLIFAIFLIKPTPFCLLDEVDAPLDDANVGRYNEMVKEMSKNSQFILITHNKRTMEMVDTLYGVTMEEPGVSKLISVRLSERARESAAA